MHMIFGKKSEKKISSKELLKMAGKCSPKGLKELLKKIDAELDRSNGEDYDLRIAKTIITSRLTNMRDTGKIPL